MLILRFQFIIQVEILSNWVCLLEFTSEVWTRVIYLWQRSSICSDLYTVLWILSGFHCAMALLCFYWDGVCTSCCWHFLKLSPQAFVLPCQRLSPYLSQLCSTAWGLLRLDISSLQLLGWITKTPTIFQLLTSKECPRKWANSQVFLVSSAAVLMLLQRSLNSHNLVRKGKRLFLFLRISPCSLPQKPF